VETAFSSALGRNPDRSNATAVRAWLYRIAANEALGLLRRRSAAAPWSEASGSVPDGAGGVVERLAVRAALARLSAEHRVILVLRLWEELSYAEIAAVLGLSLPAVKMRLSRARDQFRKFYEEQA
jgi:RNA polymerase sigma factor (sigma-70 family)